MALFAARAQGASPQFRVTAANADDTGWELWRFDGDHSTKILGDENGFALFPPVVYVNNGLMLFWGRQVPAFSGLTLGLPR